jgi:hypothetical protein
VFSGRVGSKKLKTGRYRAIVVAADASGNHSKPKALSFAVAKR